MQCPNPECEYEWVARVPNPKRCPKCQKWLPAIYEMRFVPVDVLGKMKKNVPFIGGKRGFEEGQIVLLPLEKRHESWWDLVNEDDVPPAELKRDQEQRDVFMAQAKVAAAERQKELDLDQARTRGRGA